MQDIRTDIPANTKYLYNNFIQRQPNVLDVGPALYKCYTNVLCLLRLLFHDNLAGIQWVYKMWA